MEEFEFVQYLISEYGAGLIYELFENRAEELLSRFANIYTAMEYKTNKMLLSKTNKTANPVA